MAQQQRKGRAETSSSKGFYWILAVVAVVGIGAILYAVMGSGTGEAATAPVELLTLEDADSVAQKAEPVRKGSASAPVQIVEFADFQCPGCGHFALQVMRPLQPYIDGGQVQLLFYDYPLTSIHPNAFVAARAARCAGEQDRYWDYHDVLFAQQTGWSTERNPLDAFEGYAAELGLDENAFASCLRSDRFADVVTANALVGERLGVRSTPTVYINGRNAMDSWGDPAAMRRLIEAELAGAAAGTPAAQETPRDSNRDDSAAADTAAADTAAGAPAAGEPTEA